MLCPETQLLADFAAGNVATFDQEDLLVHLDRCTTCRKEIAEISSAESVPSSLLPSSGDTIGRYELVAPLGQGAMGVVYKARDLMLHRDVALKMLSISGERDVLLREARIACQLNHEGVVRVYDVFEAQGRVWLSMELVEGVTLKTRFDARDYSLQ